MTYSDFHHILHSGAPIHLSGIGGISMRALAEMLLHLGGNVRGSDRDDSPVVAHLRQDGISVVVGHRAENTVGAALVIRTAAIPDTNPEIAAALAAGTPVISRAEAWGLIMSRFRNAVCVAGTHGKTSTTSMIATFSTSAGMDPTVMVGGELASIGGTLRLGHSQLMVAEACEYQNSFHHFAPTIGVILNIDMDHPDFFADLDAVIASFRKFAQLVPKTGILLVNGDDTNCRKAVAGIDRPTLFFGRGADCQVRAEHLTLEGGLYHFDVMVRDSLYCRLRLSVPGLHNVYNALAAAAVASVLEVPSAAFAQGIQGYTGVGRRFELKRQWRGAAVYDDYAHHPNEIEATLKAAHEIKENGRVICVFQPHTYSRTAALLPQFAAALSHADKCILCPIYAARETNTFGVTEQDLAAAIPGAEAVDSFQAAAQRLEALVQPGDVIFTMGAGDVFRVEQLLK